MVKLGLMRRGHGIEILVGVDVDTTQFPLSPRGRGGSRDSGGRRGGGARLHRYLAEFDFRYSNRVALSYNDAGRADNLLKGITGKRLT